MRNTASAFIMHVDVQFSRTICWRTFSTRSLALFAQRNLVGHIFTFISGFYLYFCFYASVLIFWLLYLWIKCILKSVVSLLPDLCFLCCCGILFVCLKSLCFLRITYNSVQFSILLISMKFAIRILPHWIDIKLESMGSLLILPEYEHGMSFRFFVVSNSFSSVFFL